MKSFFKKIIVRLLTIEAKLVIRKYKPRIIGITGTVGKTTTKDMVAHLLMSGGLKVRKSEKSYNSEIGLPLTILGEKNAWGNIFRWGGVLKRGLVLATVPVDYLEYLVLEMGVDRPGDMERFVSWLKPEAVIVTAIGEVPVHIEYFNGQETLAAEKAKLVEATLIEGEVVLNADDPAVIKMRKKTGARVTTYGFSREADVAASTLRVSKNGTSFKLNFKGNMVPVRMPYVFGKQYVYSALAAITVGKAFDLNMVKMTEALAEFISPSGRMNLIKGKNKIIILDDTYNSSPLAAMAAIETLRDIKIKNKAAILGDMLELGKYTAQEHRKIGELVARSGIDILIGVGPRSQFAIEAAKAAGMTGERRIFWFADSEEAGSRAMDILPTGCLTLVKGSQGVRMEKVVEKIMDNPEDKEKLLVRQEKEWQNR